MNCIVIQKNKVRILNSTLWVLKLRFYFRPETVVHPTEPNVSNIQVEWEELSLPENQTRERWRSINSPQQPATQTVRISMTVAGFLLLKSLVRLHFDR